MDMATELQMGLEAERIADIRYKRALRSKKFWLISALTKNRFRQEALRELRKANSGK